MRLLVLLLSALLLSACTNMVRSETPWFGPADSVGAPPLRDGVWGVVDPDCRFDADLPLERWPACAQGRVIRGSEELGLNAFHTEDDLGRRTRSDYDWSSEAFVLAAGAPRIHQRACGEPRRPERGEDDVERPMVDEAVNRLAYCYAAVNADTLDAEGRIVAFTAWPIWCGPFPEGENGLNVTEAPFAGLVVLGEHCIAADVAALRGAATASETLHTRQPGRARFRWIRDGWR